MSISISNLSKLRVKIKSLSAEQQFIKHEERKHLGAARWITRNPDRANDYAGLDDRWVQHRTAWVEQRDHRLDLRPEIRATLLAYAYLRGKPYSSIEPTACWKTLPHKIGKWFTPDTSRVRDMVLKYGPKTDKTKDLIQREIEVWMGATAV